MTKQSKDFKQQLGQTLQRARTKSGATLKTASAQTKINEKYLKALEAGDLSIFSSEVHARGLLKSYSKYLGLKQDVVLAMLRRESETTPKTNERQQRSDKPQESKFKLSNLATQRNLIIAAFAGFFLIFGLYIAAQVNSLIQDPYLSLTSPVEISGSFEGEIFVAGNSFKIEGETDPRAAISYNAQLLPLEDGNQFSTPEIPLTDGSATAVITATNQFGRTSEIVLQIRRGSTGIASIDKMSVLVEVTDEVTPILIRVDGKIEFDDRAFPGDLIQFDAEDVFQIESNAPYNLLVTINGEQYTFTERNKIWQLIDGNVLEKEAD